MSFINIKCVSKRDLNTLLPRLPCHQAANRCPRSLQCSPHSEVDWNVDTGPLRGTHFAGTDCSRAGVVLRPTAAAAPAWSCRFLIMTQTTHPSACQFCTVALGVVPETKPCFLRPPSGSVSSIQPQKKGSFSSMAPVA